MTWKILSAISTGKTRYIKHRKYLNFLINNKVTGDKNAICLYVLSYPVLSLNICRKFEFLIPQGSVPTYLRWGGWCFIDFAANFIHVPAVQTFWKSVKIWQSYRRFKGGNFFETQCRDRRFILHSTDTIALNNDSNKTQSEGLPERHTAHLSWPPIVKNDNNNNKQCSARCKVQGS